MANGNGNEGTDLAVRGPALPAAAITAELVEQVIAHGDLSKLTAAQKVAYYKSVCESMGLNPLTRPLEYLYLNNKLVLYANAGAAAQLRAKHGVSVRVLERWKEDGLYCVRVAATTSTGRRDEAMAAVPIDGLVGEKLANAYAKCETKAHRRVTLALLGLSWLDMAAYEADLGPVPVAVDDETGEVVDQVEGRPYDDNDAVAVDDDGEAETAHPTPEPPPSPDQLRKAWTARIAAAVTSEALKAVGEEIGQAGLPREVVDSLKLAYGARVKAVQAAR